LIARLSAKRNLSVRRRASSTISAVEEGRADGGPLAPIEPVRVTLRELRSHAPAAFVPVKARSPFAPLPADRRRRVGKLILGSIAAAILLGVSAGIYWGHLARGEQTIERPVPDPIAPASPTSDAPAEGGGSSRAAENADEPSVRDGGGGDDRLNALGFRFTPSAGEGGDAADTRFTTSPIEGQPHDKLVTWLVAASVGPADAFGGKADPYVTVSAIYDNEGYEDVYGVGKCTFTVKEDVDGPVTWGTCSIPARGARTAAHPRESSSSSCCSRARRRWAFSERLRAFAHARCRRHF
jgi:hypothetical protein